MAVLVGTDIPADANADAGVGGWAGGDTHHPIFRARWEVSLISHSPLSSETSEPVFMSYELGQLSSLRHQPASHLVPASDEANVSIR